MEADVVIVGTGVSGLYAALNLPRSLKIIMITKDEMTKSDSFLAQGGICYWKEDSDYKSFFDDTMKAGHYENNPAAVEVMIKESRAVIGELEEYGVKFAKKEGKFLFTREGAHSTNRILFHDDITGKEITSNLLKQVKLLENVKIYEYVTMVDILEKNRSCYGIIVENQEKVMSTIYCNNVILASGGIGGLYEHSTNYPHLTGDALKIAKKHNITLEHLDYVQIHPTTLYSKEKGRRFLISESVRGEGAVLYDSHMKRFTNELLPRDVLTAEIRKQMEKDGTEHVWLSMVSLGADVIKKRFPNIYQHCLEQGYDVTKECIPVVPAQHYFMGGIKVNLNSKTSMDHLYAAGETSCNGVHGANRLASNSLLESLVFARRAAKEIGHTTLAEEMEKEKRYVG